MAQPEPYNLDAEDALRIVRALTWAAETLRWVAPDVAAACSLLIGPLSHASVIYVSPGPPEPGPPRP